MLLVAAVAACSKSKSSVVDDGSFETFVPRTVRDNKLAPVPSFALLLLLLDVDRVLFVRARASELLLPFADLPPLLPPPRPLPDVDDGRGCV